MKIPILLERKHVLPNGCNQIYLNLNLHINTLKFSFDNHNKLGLCMFETSTTDKIGYQLFNTGTVVEIIDFNSSFPANKLELTIKGVQHFSIAEIFEEQKTLFAKIKLSFNNDQFVQLNNNEYNILAKNLKLFFKKNPSVSCLYKEKEWDNIKWICDRLIEILPLSPSDKQALIHNQNFEKVCNYLLQIMTVSH